MPVNVLGPWGLTKGRKEGGASRAEGVHGESSDGKGWLILMKPISLSGGDITFLIIPLIGLISSEECHTFLKAWQASLTIIQEKKKIYHLLNRKQQGN